MQVNGTYFLCPSTPSFSLPPPLFPSSSPPSHHVIINTRDTRTDDTVASRYGENYGSGNYVVSGSVPSQRAQPRQPPSNCFSTGNVLLPKLVVYTSRDLVTWTFGGFLHNNTSPAWDESGLWKFAPNGKSLTQLLLPPWFIHSYICTGTWWSPCAVWSEKRSKMILWWSATTGECCDATFGVAESSDGVHFDLVTLEGRPGWAFERFLIPLVCNYTEQEAARQSTGRRCSLTTTAGEGACELHSRLDSHMQRLRRVHGYEP